MLDRRSIPVKLALVVGIPVVASLLFAFLALRTVEQVRIGGDRYNQVAEGNDLRADILPPPFFIVESMVVAQLMAEVTDEVTYEDLRTQLDQLELDYQAAYQRWRNDLDEDGDQAEVRRLLTEDAYASANEFYNVVESELYPAVEEGLDEGDPEVAHEVLTGKLVPLYQQHRASIVEAVPQIERRVSALEENATSDAQQGYLILIGALAALTLAALVLATLVARAIVRPIRRLTRAADDVARALKEADLDEEAPDLEPIDLRSSRELNLAADSFNTLIGTTTGLLDRHARMRRNLGDIFQNLGRRNHGLLTRSLRVITELEQTETDPETLDRLFRLDHLATRIRRNAENLLVLAGSQSARAVERQADITDILRSALSEIESYTRVDRPELEPVAIKAGAVADVTHLLAELIENATNFSPPECRVRVVGAFVDDGYAVTVVDEGLGMRDDAIEEANQRIQKLSSLDLTPTRTLGLYVVGRLAQRHGIRVRLLEGSLRGMVAKVVLPRSILTEPAMPVFEVEPDRLRFERVLDQAVSAGARGGTALTFPGLDRANVDVTPAAAVSPPVAPAAVAYAPPEPSAFPSRAFETPVSEPPVLLPPAAPGSSPYPAPTPAAYPASAPVSAAYPAPVSGDYPASAPARGGPAAADVAPPTRPSPPGPVEERGGMRRRVRGAQMPQTQLTGLGPSATPGDRVEAEPLDRHRSSLRNFQRAVDQGTRDARTSAGEDEA